MCFNKAVSIQTYIIGMFGSLLLYHKHPALGAFYMTVVQMQLIEFLLWSCRSCSKLNAVATGAGIVINHLEPLVLYAMLLHSTSMPWPVHAIATLYTLVTIKYTLKAFRNTLCTTVTPESAPHLQWQWNYEDGNGMYYVLFLLFLVLLSVYGIKGDLGTVHALIVVSTFIFSKAVYGSRKATGALWCFFAAFVPYILLFLA